MNLQLVHKFSATVQHWPLASKTVIGGLTASVGEITAQHILGNEKIDWKRTAAVTIFGVSWTGPFNHFYLRALAHKFPVSEGLEKALVSKLLFQTLFINPFVYIPAYFITICTSSGMNIAGMKQYVSSNYTDTLTSCSIFWLPISWVAFRYIPEHLQSVSMAGVSLLWNTVLAYKTNQTQLNLDMKR